MQYKFQVGDEVVCIIEDGWGNIYTGQKTTGPAFNEVCIVTAIQFHPTVRLVGLQLKGWGDVWFNAERFRPAYKAMSQLRALLTAPAPRELEHA